jgi:GNAT superfamily N-acetyltransferase
MSEQWQRDGYVVTTDPDAIDMDALHTFLHQSYWARGIPLEVVREAVDHSLNFTLLQPPHFVGFARVITDYATFAYVTDVFVLPEHRGRGLGSWMMGCVMAHPQLQGLRRWCLVTRDAHAVYARVGFSPTAIPERWMELLDPKVYERRRGGQQPGP